MPEPTTEAFRWRIHGRVQGVYYRHFTMTAARELELVGWTRNLADGTVEVEVAGPRERLDTLRERLREGPLLARVDKIVEEPIAADPGWSGFEIRY